ncbi:RNA polymerase sigma-70 factor [Chitinophaga horti]|uniref:RNA polymerase sigma-70 factor n=1 Tax=Chitinophaga horti TaxID=2920382 RepID=A0ABY6IVB2_9BACT|nr:RNA polymerase sigma-70 factor [Chitinophaga horti]UYQ91141.1 RNA polymerase sigma-70 factor [Chitinophaga horti]
MKKEFISHPADLRERLAAGEEPAFLEFFHTYSHHIYNVAFLMTKSTTLAEDMVQEVFLKIWLQRAQLAQVENLKAYLYVCARRHILNELRKKSASREFTGALHAYFSETADNPEQALLRKESRGVLHEAIDRLPDRQRLIYRLSKENGLKQEEIAHQLNISQHTVRNHLAQALVNIRHFLEQSATGLLLLICLLQAGM